MPGEMTKTSLLAAMKTGRQGWQRLLDQLNEAAMSEPGVEGVWSVKEIVAHIAGYEQYFSAYLIDLRQEPLEPSGMTARLDQYYQQHLNLYRRAHPDFPERLDDIHGDQLNVIFVAACQPQLVQEVLATERQAYERLLAEVLALSDATLTRGHRNGERSLIERIPNQCYVHYRMHMPAIERWWGWGQRKP
jgi:hypothetical protein